MCQLDTSDVTGIGRSCRYCPEFRPPQPTQSATSRSPSHHSAAARGDTVEPPVPPPPCVEILGRDRGSRAHRRSTRRIHGPTTRASRTRNRCVVGRHHIPRRRPVRSTMCTSCRVISRRQHAGDGQPGFPAAQCLGPLCGRPRDLGAVAVASAHGPILTGEVMDEAFNRPHLAGNPIVRGPGQVLLDPRFAAQCAA